MVSKLPAVFSGLAVVFGILLLTKYKENKVIRLCFYVSLVISGLARLLYDKSTGVAPSPVDIGVIVIFGVGAILNLVSIAQERRRSQ